MPNNIPLHCAVQTNNFEKVKFIIDNNYEIDLDEQDANGNSAVTMCATSNSWKILEILINKGANVNVVNSYGDYAIETAIELKHDIIVKLLKDAPSYKAHKTTANVVQNVQTNPNLTTPSLTSNNANGLFKNKIIEHSIKKVISEERLRKKIPPSA